MATHTLATSGNLTALTFLPGYNSGMAAADIATLCELIASPSTGGNLPYISGGAFTAGGQLFVPHRGVLQIFPGDVVAVDSTTGWPILVSKKAIASGPWTFT